MAISQEKSIGIIALVGLSSYINGALFGWRLDIPMLLLSISSISLIALRSAKFFNDTRLTTSIIILVLSYALSTIASEHPSRSVDMGYILLPSILLYILISNGLGAEHVLYVLIILAIDGTIMSSSYILLSFLQPHHLIDTSIPRGATIIMVPNDILFSVLLLPLWISILALKKNILLSLLAIFSAITCLAASLALRSRISLLIIAIESIFCMALFSNKTMHCFSLILLFGVLCPLYFIIAASGKHGLLADPRIVLWLAGLQSTLDAPILGHGPRSFLYIYDDYVRSGWIPSFVVFDQRGMPWAHNIYIETLAETGVIGFGALCYLIYRLFNSLHATALLPHSKPIKLCCYGVFISLMAFCISGFFELSLIREWVNIYLFCLSGTINLLEKTRET